MNYQRPNKKRIQDVFNKKIPDRVPNFEVLVEDPTFSYVMGRSMPSNTLNNIPPNDYIEFVNRVGQDVIGMNFFSIHFSAKQAMEGLNQLILK